MKLSRERLLEFQEAVINGADISDAVAEVIDLAKHEGITTPDAIFFYTTDGPFGFMCNFYKARQNMHGWGYATNEHWYQACKATDLAMHTWISQCPKPFHAMRAGRALRKSKGEIRDNWQDIKYEVMLRGLREKFRQNPELRKMLVDTGSAPLHEASPIDMVWGILGNDWLGQQLMVVRNEAVTGELDEMLDGLPRKVWDERNGTKILMYSTMGLL